MRVILCDDHAEFRDGLTALLNSVREVTIAGHAADGDEAVSLAELEQPDVVLMDLDMPGVNGIEAIRRMVGNAPEIGIIVLTVREDDDSVFAAMRAGARGCLLKGASKDDLVRALRIVAAGDAMFGPGIAQRMTRFFGPTTRTELVAELSPRETLVLRLMSDHLTNPEIARRLGVSEKAIRGNVSAIFAKLQNAGRGRDISAAWDSRQS